MVFMIERKIWFNDRYWNSAVFLDSSYLRFPQHQTVQVLPDNWNQEIFEQAQLADFYSSTTFDTTDYGYSDIEIQKIKRIWDWKMALGTKRKQVNNKDITLVNFSRTR